jgi:hypothetical protein
MDGILVLDGAEERKAFIPHRRRRFNCTCTVNNALQRCSLPRTIAPGKTLGEKDISMRVGIGRGLGAALLLVTIVTSFAQAQDATLLLTGNVPGGSVTLTMEQIAALPQRELKEQPTSFPEPLTFKGPNLAEVLKLAGATGSDLTLSAADDYKVDISAKDIADFNPILAIEKNGARMAPDDFGPFFVMWPFKEKPEIDNETYQAKAIWQVVKIEVK